ncbi:hypothetical protein AGMMS49992_08520 [Clostridia bacterium]|nr:hypothetical protein AGMMS49992_08520 [Clostridia bacterium]
MLKTGLKSDRATGHFTRHCLCAALIALLVCLVAANALASSTGTYYIADTVYLYAKPDSTSSTSDQLLIGQAVTLLGYGTGADGGMWHFITVVATGESGYIPSGNIMSGDPRATPTPVPSGATATKHVVSNKNGATLRSMPLDDGDIVVKVPFNTVLTQIGKSSGLDGATWYYVEIGGYKGYVLAADLTGYTAPITGGSDGSPSAPGNGSTATAGYRYVVTATRYVNMRSAPSTSASVVAQVKAGEVVVEIQSVIGADGYTWRYVSWGNKNGYMRSDYLTVISGGGVTSTAIPTITPTPKPNAGYTDFVITYSSTSMMKAPDSSTVLVWLPAGVALRPVSTYTDDKNIVWYQVIYSTAGNDQVGYVQRAWVLDNPTWDQLVMAGAVTPSPSPTREAAYSPDGYLITVSGGVPIYRAAALSDKSNGNFDWNPDPSYRLATIASAGTILKIEKAYLSDTTHDYIYYVQFKVWEDPPKVAPTPTLGVTPTNNARYVTYYGYVEKGYTRYPTNTELANASSQGWGSLWQPTPVPTAVPTPAPIKPYQVQMGISHVALRTGPSTSASMLVSIPPNSIAQYLSQVTGADGYVWYQVTYYSKTGWIRSDLCTLIYPGGSTSVTPNTPAPGGNYTGSLMAITNSGTNMRTGMGTSFGIVAKLTRGEIVRVVGSGTGTDGNTWYQVTTLLTNKSGYVRGDLLRQLTPTEAQQYASSGGAATAPPPSSNTPTTPDTSVTLKLGTTGTSVATLQSYLVAQGYLGSNFTSGTYDAATFMAVRSFQQARGLTVDGVAGSATLAALYSGSSSNNSSGSNSGSSSGSTSTGDSYVPPKSVELNSWTTGNIKAILEANPNGIVVVSVDSGISFRVKYRWGSNHADCEPETANDTAKINQIKAYYGTDQTRYRMPVWVKVGGHTFAGSCYAEGHDASSDTIPGNNFPGVLCLHFKDSSTHTNPNGTGTSEHQQEVMYAYNQQPY